MVAVLPGQAKYRGAEASFPLNEVPLSKSDSNARWSVTVWWELHGLQSIGIVTGKETDTYLVFWKGMGHGIMMRNEC